MKCDPDELDQIPTHETIMWKWRKKKIDLFSFYIFQNVQKTSSGARTVSASPTTNFATNILTAMTNRTKSTAVSIAKRLILLLILGNHSESINETCTIHGHTWNALYLHDMYMIQ